MVYSTFRMAVLAVGALALAGAAAHATGNDGDFNCGISTQSERGLMAIEGVLQSPTALSGEYRFALRSNSSGGSTHVSQGGQFSAAAGAPVSLGKVMVNAGSTIDVDFSVETGGKRFDCSAPLTTLT